MEHYVFKARVWRTFLLEVAQQLLSSHVKQRAHEDQLRHAIYLTP